MGRSDNFRRQHDKILALSSELEGLTPVVGDPKQAQGVRKKISELLGVLQVHLSMEDEALYPRLMQSPDAHTRATAKRFQDEMGTLGKRTKELIGKWTASYIEREPAFWPEMKKALGALRERIDRENVELYPLNDVDERVGGAR